MCETLNSGKDIRPDTGLPQKSEQIYEVLEYRNTSWNNADKG